MAIYGYTKNYKLIKPQFNTDTWHDYIYDNLDTIDAVMSAIYASGNWKGFWAKNMTYVAGDVIIDQDTDTMYKVMIDHVTSANTFAEEQTAHPDYYELWSPNNLAESWATKTDGKVSNTDYSAKAYAISSGLINDGSAKEWAVGSGVIGNTNEYSAKKYATDAHNDYISLTTNVNVVAVGSNIANVNAVGQSISNVNTVAGNISSVNVAAANIEFIKSAENNANDAKNSKIEAQNSAVTAQLMAAQAQDWAIKTDGKVDGTNYSSKYYAGQASNSANNSHIWAEGTDAQVQALGGVHSSKGWAEQSTNANISLTNLDAAGQAKFDAKANIDLSNLNNTGNEAALNLNSKGIRTVVETYKNGSNWYRVWSDGWIEQGSMAVSINATAGVQFVINYFKQFSVGDNQMITMTPFEQDANDTGTNFTVIGRAANNFTGVNVGFARNPLIISWYACGY